MRRAGGPRKDGGTSTFGIVRSGPKHRAPVGNGFNQAKFAKGGSNYKSNSGRAYPKAPSSIPFRDDGGARFSTENKANQQSSALFGTGNLGGGSAPSYFDANSNDPEIKWEKAAVIDGIDAKLGFPRFARGWPKKKGWLLNMQQTLIKTDEWGTGASALDFYFIQESGATFKATVSVPPYFFISVEHGMEVDVEEHLKRKFETTLWKIERVQKQDLDMGNHLIDPWRTFLKLVFHNVTDLNTVKRAIHPIIKKNQKQREHDDYLFASLPAMGKVEEDMEDVFGDEAAHTKHAAADPMDQIVDIREHDVPYIARAAIDFGYRVGHWYDVTCDANDQITLTRDEKMIKRADPVILAYDIETSKAPLKFPDPAHDMVMMISYMVDGQGYLIVNRAIVSEDIEDFEYSPNEEYQGPFIVFNEEDERMTLMRFFEHIVQLKPHVLVTYNGDAFDWPFIDQRATANGISMYEEIGFFKNNEDEYESAYASHMDCFKWVKRDSYLPAGSHGLKAVTKHKLGYDPLELDPEDMVPFASEKPHVLANYSVSDAVATYYLYMKYVHPFTFSLCTIIPLIPDEVLRKGSGTLCEMLLMVEAYQNKIIMPNKHMDAYDREYNGHLLKSETYVGGHVEALESGVFRSDIPTKFRTDPDAFDEVPFLCSYNTKKGTWSLKVKKLMGELDQALAFSIEKEHNTSMDEIANYDEVRAEIMEALQSLRDAPNRLESPLIYHLDVAAMYPNIILTNRLQPTALVNEASCAACDFNRPGAECQRDMQWQWRGEYFPTDRGEVNMIRSQLEVETFPPVKQGREKRRYIDLSQGEQETVLQKRLGEYSRKVYKKNQETKLELRTSTVCQREHSFYVDTVRNFRDRRYDYKGLHKQWKKKLEKADSMAAQEECKSMIVLYDSLQLAHKCILNSFYGYMMRKGSRWYSMEMAGIVCWTGANIIRMARVLVERIGRPLELDTDGIWCILPASFPENFELKKKNGGKITISYPCTMLNHRVHAAFTNHQYANLVQPETHTYAMSSENSIFFEVDGPYLAMILPASKEEDKLLKKRYAVFNEDKTLAELKGFEVKRRGELKLIKTFQSQIFSEFLQGTTLQECYAAVANIANHYLDILDTKGKSLEDDELVDLISENRSMSKSLQEYGSQKSTSITTARRLAEFLGADMVRDKGLNCKFIVSQKPLGTPVTERAVPVAIFSAETSVRETYLKKWLNDNGQQDFDLRTILDWAYYRERFSSVIQKLITIPAAMQKVPNPVPRVLHPDWLKKRVNAQDEKYKQHNLKSMFKAGMARQQLLEAQMKDMEDAAGPPSPPPAEGEDRSDEEEEVLAEGMPIVTSTKRPAEPIVETPKKQPKWEEDYPGWIASKKAEWRRLRLARQEEMAAEQSTVSARGAMFTGHRANTWQTIQIVAKSHDQFVIWGVVDGGTMQPIKLTIPRTLFVNSFKALSGSALLDHQAVKKQLPRSHTAHHLTAFTIKESVFQSNPAVISSLREHPYISGIYGLKNDLLEEAILHIGCHGGLRRAIDGVPLRKDLRLDTLKLEHLTRLSADSYMEGVPLHYLYVYHLANANGDKEMIGFFPSNAAKARVVLYQPGGINQLPASAALDTLYQEIVAATVGDDPRAKHHRTKFMQYHASLDFEVAVVREKPQLYKALNKYLGDYLGERRGPTVVLLQSAKPGMVVDHVPRLGDLPYVPIPFLNSDGAGLPTTLDWQRVALKRMLHWYVECGSWLTDHIHMCRYADIPMGNMGSDPPVTMIDVLYGRHLMAQDFVLWSSPSERPDLGTREYDECTSPMHELHSPNVNVPGGYASIVVEFDMQHLAVDAVINSHFLSDAEGLVNIAGVDAAQYSMEDHMKGKANNVFAMGDSDSFCPQAFRCLKQVLQSWVRAISANGQPVARILLEHFHRWLRSSKARLFDPALLTLVQGMMTKVWAALLKEMSRLGAKVVYGDYHKLILLTSKTNAENAQAYCDYMVKALRGHRLFNLLAVNPLTYYDHLLWMDTYNHCGILTGKGEMKMRDTWNMQAYLPQALHHSFKANVYRFMTELYRFKHGLTEGEEILSTQERVIKRAHSKEEELGHAREYLAHDVTERLLALIPDIRTRLDTMRRSENPQENAIAAFPKLPGSYLAMDEPALEFIKAICHVYGLTRGVEDVVLRLKKQLLTLIQVRDFSKEAQFKNPCQTFVLHQVICTYCNRSSDFDFCRDSHLLYGAGGEEARVWTCTVCQNEFDKDGIEHMLVEHIKWRFAAYQSQGLVCTKCKRAKNNILMDICDACATPFEVTVKQKPLKTELESFCRIATYYDMPLLEEVATWSLRGVAQ